MKVAIYCRLSEEDRNKQFETDDSNSIKIKNLCCCNMLWNRGGNFYNIYSDDDYYPALTAAGQNLTVCSKTPNNTDLILSFAKHSHVLPANWNL